MSAEQAADILQDSGSWETILRILGTSWVRSVERHIMEQYIQEMNGWGPSTTRLARVVVDRAHVAASSGQTVTLLVTVLWHEHGWLDHILPAEHYEWIEAEWAVELQYKGSQWQMSHCTPVE